MEKSSSIFGNILMSLGLILLLLSFVFFNYVIFADPNGDVLGNFAQATWISVGIINILVSIGFILAGGLLRIKSQ